MSGTALKDANLLSSVIHGKVWARTRVLFYDSDRTFHTGSQAHRLTGWRTSHSTHVPSSSADRCLPGCQTAGTATRGLPSSDSVLTSGVVCRLCNIFKNLQRSAAETCCSWEGVEWRGEREEREEMSSLQATRTHRCLSPQYQKKTCNE